MESMKKIWMTPGPWDKGHRRRYIRGSKEYRKLVKEHGTHDAEDLLEKALRGLEPFITDDNPEFGLGRLLHKAVELRDRRNFPSEEARKAYLLGSFEYIDAVDAYGRLAADATVAKVLA